MRIYQFGGQYVATQKHADREGGVIGRGRSHYEAVMSCLMKAGLVGRKLDVRFLDDEEGSVVVPA